MRVKKSVARMYYSRLGGRLVGRLRLREAIQGLAGLAWTNSGTLQLDLNGLEARFSALTEIELRVVEGAWFGERRMLDAIQQMLRPGDTFLDAGSNLGIFTVFAAKMVAPTGGVIAFEPEGLAHVRLERNVQINHLYNVKLLKLALSDKRAEKQMILGEPNAVSQSAHLAEAEGPSQIVQAVNYDSMVDEEGFPIPRVVKMDIEGHEYFALQGMRKALSSPSCVALFCEIHPYALPPDVCLNNMVRMIQSFGFESISMRRAGAQWHVISRKTGVENGT